MRAKKIIENVARDLTKERNDRCIPIAEEIAKIIVNNGNFAVKEIEDAEMTEKYANISEQVIAYMLEKELPVGEIDYCFSLMRAPFDRILQMVAMSVNRHLSTAQDKMWGKPSNSVTMKDLDDKLKQ